MSDIITDQPAPFAEYEVAGVGTVIDPDGETGYRVRTSDGRIIGFPAQSGDPSQANAAADIAFAIANPPVPPPPGEVPAWRVKAVAHLAGFDAAIAAALAALPDPQKTVASAAWNEGNVIDRNSATVVGLAAQIGITPAQMDDLFRQAANIAI